MDSTCIKRQVDEVAEQLMERRLLPYQQASVLEICRKFQKKSKVLLADEVGLGKTEIAKGVVALLAQQHWAAANQSRPFRVAYLCPNQSIASQNFVKLQIFQAAEQQTAQSQALGKDLKEALDAYQKGRKKTVHNVYTRTWEWLLSLSTGTSLAEAMGGLRSVYLPSPDQRDTPEVIQAIKSERDSSQNPRWSPRVSELRITCMRKLENTPLHRILSIFWEKAIQINHSENSRTYYYFNRQVAVYLQSGMVQDDYRLSMQHLYACEAEQASQGHAMDLECLTPRTSLKISSGTGTYEERALIAASLQLQNVRDKAALDALRGNVGEASFNRALEMYRTRIAALEKKPIVPKIKIDPSTLIPALYKPFVSALREAFIQNNIQNYLQYDLIVLDEFQNYGDLISGAVAPRSEAEQIAHAFFQSAQKGGCRILMLSATPFGLTDYALNLEDQEENGLDQRAVRSAEDAFASFFTLAEFLYEGTDFSGWKQQWMENRLSPQVLRAKPEAQLLQQKSVCESLLFEELGLVRTERIAAARHAPVLADCALDLPEDYRNAMRANRYAWELGLQGYRSEYGRTTPFALSFASGYSITQEDSQKPDWNWESSPLRQQLFLSASALDGSSPISTGAPPFERLKEDILGCSPAGFSAASMLWIPPCRSSAPLRGAFTGREGFSKTLIFSHYKMTPLAFTYLLCHEAKCRLKPSHQELPFDDRARLITWCRTYIGGLSHHPAVTKQLEVLLMDLFSGSYGMAAVRSVYPAAVCPDYVQAVSRYAEDGCLYDVLDEYLELLLAEKNGQSWEAAAVLKQVRELQIARPKLLLYKNSVVTSEERPADNKFAVGLFSEQENADTERRMAKIRLAFNSPFLPFVFTSTSIGTEGIDLHWYARNVVHWSIPRRPIDLEQREGRVLRFNCHAFRLNQGLIEARQSSPDAVPVQEADAIRAPWLGSGLYNCQLNFFSDQEYDPQSGKGCFHILRHIYASSFAPEQTRYQQAVRLVSTYRLMLGQDPEILAHIDDLTGREKYLLCLAPFQKKKENAELRQHQGQ